MAMDDSKKSAPRYIKIALIASLAVNVLVIGAMVGVISHGGSGDGKRGGDRRGTDGAIGIYGRALEGPDRRAVGKAMFDGREARSDMRANLRALAEEAVQVLEQTPFDKDAFAEILQQQQGQIKERSDVLQTALVNHLAGMSDEQRMVYANRLVEILERGDRRGKDRAKDRN